MLSTSTVTQIRILSPTLHSFLPRKVLGSSLESSSQVHRFTHQKKDKSPPKSLPLSSFCWLPQTESPATRRKLLSTLPSSLPLIFSGPATRKRKPFHVSLYIYIYIYIYAILRSFELCWWFVEGRLGFLLINDFIWLRK